MQSPVAACPVLNYRRCGVVDLRTLVPLDLATVLQSVRWQSRRESRQSDVRKLPCKVHHKAPLARGFVNFWAAPGGAVGGPTERSALEVRAAWCNPVCRQEATTAQAATPASCGVVHRRVPLSRRSLLCHSH